MDIRKKLNYITITSHIYSKWIKELNIKEKNETIKEVKENVGKHLFDLGVNKAFLSKR